MPDKEALSSVFNADANEFSRIFLDTANPPRPDMVNRMIPLHSAMVASMLEQFLFFDKVAFKVYGENIPMSILIKQFGVRNFEALLEQDAIEFVLWTPMVGYMDNAIEGIVPLVSGNLNSPAHSDPDESIKLGFNWLKEKPSRAVRRGLQKKIRKLYKVPESHVSGNAAKLVMDAYKSNKLASLGLPNEVDLMKLNKEQSKKLTKYSEDVVETTLLSQYGYSSFEKYSYSELSKESIKSISKALKVSDNLSKLFEIENLPDIKKLYLDNKVTPDVIFNLRQTKNSIKFRAWLNKVSDKADASEISKEYIDSISKAKGPLETKSGKLLKSLSLFTLGGGVGALIGGLPAALVGSGIGKLIEPAADLGLDLVDTYFLDGLLKGWTPRNFMDSVRQQSGDVNRG